MNCSQHSLKVASASSRFLFSHWTRSCAVGQTASRLAVWRRYPGPLHVPCAPKRARNNERKGSMQLTLKNSKHQDTRATALSSDSFPERHIVRMTHQTRDSYFCVSAPKKKEMIDTREIPNSPKHTARWFGDDSGLWLRIIDVALKLNPPAETRDGSS